MSKIGGVGSFYDIDPRLDWNFIEKLGEGAFGAVWRSIKMTTADPLRVAGAPHEIAVKRMHVGKGDEAAAHREVSLTSQLASPYVVQFFGCYWWDRSVFLCLELCDASLQDLIDKVKEKGLSEERIKDVATAIFSGLRDLHRLNICHRDVKPGNVLIRSNSTCCLADFGISRQSNTTVMNFETMIGSPFFMAPEQVDAGSSDRDGASYDEKVDVWAAGITLLCCTDGRPPFYDMNPLHALFMIGKEDPPKMKNVDKYSSKLNELITLSLTKSPRDRPSCLELLKLPFFKSNSSSSSSRKSRHGSSSQKRLSKHRSQRDSAPTEISQPVSAADEDLDAEIVSAALNAINKRDSLDDGDEEEDQPPPPPPPRRTPSEKDVDEVSNWLHTRKDLMSVLQERFMMNDGYIGPPIEELRGQAFLALLEQVDKASEQERLAHDLRRKEARERRRHRKLERERRRLSGSGAGTHSRSSGTGATGAVSSSSTSSAVTTIDETSSASNPSSEPSSRGGSKDNTASSGAGGLRDQLRDVEMKLERLRRLAGDDTGGSDFSKSSQADATGAGLARKPGSSGKPHSRGGSHRRRASLAGSELDDDGSSAASSTAGSSRSASSSSRSAAEKFCQVCQLNVVAAKVTLDNGSKLLLCKPCAIASKNSGRVPASPNASAGRRPAGPPSAKSSSPLASGKSKSGDALGKRDPLQQQQQQQQLVPPISEWTEKDVALWVTEQLRTDVYRDAFIDNLVNGELLLTLRDEDLKELLSIDPPLHRRRLVLEIGRLQEKVAAGQGAWPTVNKAVEQTEERTTADDWRSL